MEEFGLLLSEAKAVGIDILASLEKTAEYDSTPEIREVVQSAVQSGENMTELLEEALELADSEEDQARVELALNRMEDALDAGQVLLTSGDISANLEEMRLRTEEALSSLITEDDADY